MRKFSVCRICFRELASEGKIDADTSKWRQFFALYSFERKAKVLAPWAEGMRSLFGIPAS